MQQDAVALAFGAAGVEDILHSLEQLLSDNCGMPPGVLLALIDDVTQVVGVGKHLVQCRGRNGTFAWVAGCAAAGQPRICHRRFKSVDAVVASGVQLEGSQHQWRSFFIEFDGVDLSAFDLDAGVAVAEFRYTDCAALDRLITHLEPDVLARQLVLDIIEDVGHSLHGFGEDTLPEVFAGRHQFDAELVQQAFCDGGVDVVAEGARACVDDDVPDVWVLL
nr:hypothetical protein [Nocardia cerradoensis]